MKENGLIHELIHINDTMPSLDEFQEMMEPYKQGGSLFIFDDTISQLNSDFQQLFCNSTHHFNASVIYVSQILKLNDDVWRVMSYNTHYMVLMSNSRETQQISTLSSQYNKRSKTFLLESFLDATENKPYSYLFVDYKQNTLQNLRVLSKIFPNQFPVEVYVVNK